MGNNEYVPAHEVVAKGVDTKQYLDETDYLHDGLVQPFFSFDEMLFFYYSNVYHRRCLSIKARMLSQFKESDLKKHLPAGMGVRRFLNALNLDLGIYGNYFIEQAGVPSNYSLFHLPAFQARLNTKREIYQVQRWNKKQKLEGFHMSTHSPRSRFYGEPDYLAVLKQISVTAKADTYNEKFFDNGGRPDLALIFENAIPSKEVRQSFMTFFKDNFGGGVENVHKALMLWTGKDPENKSHIKFEKLSEITDLSFKDLKYINRDEIITAHGTPPRLVGIVTSGQLGSSRELIDQLHAYNEMEIKPQQTLIDEFFDSIDIKHESKPIDVTNFKDDSDLITGLVQAGIIEVQEAREILQWSKNI